MPVCRIRGRRLLSGLPCSSGGHRRARYQDRIRLRRQRDGYETRGLRRCRVHWHRLRWPRIGRQSLRISRLHHLIGSCGTVVRCHVPAERNAWAHAWVHMTAVRPGVRAALHSLVIPLHHFDMVSLAHVHALGTEERLPHSGIGGCRRTEKHGDKKGGNDRLAHEYFPCVQKTGPMILGDGLQHTTNTLIAVHETSNTAHGDLPWHSPASPPYHLSAQSSPLSIFEQTALGE